MLVCKRPEGSSMAGSWEFPGGKVEEDEDPRDALARELHEELGVKAEVNGVYDVVFHRYDFGNVLLLFFYAEIVEGRPLPLHHDEIRWVPKGQLTALEFLPADRELIERLASEA